LVAQNEFIMMWIDVFNSMNNLVAEVLWFGRETKSHSRTNHVVDGMLKQSETEIRF
jgi:hypothetical protein